MHDFWRELKIILTADKAQELSDFLFDHQALAVSFYDAEDQPLYEPAPGTTPLWEKVKVVGLFESNIDLQHLLTQIRTLIQDDIVYTIEDLQNKDFTTSWLEHFNPLAFKNNLWISPSQLADTITDENAIKVILDPGLAFGTGTHATTRMCINWLATHSLQNLTIIDYGCGSGILAITALKLGAKQVFAVDNDPQALTATINNAKQNNIRDSDLIPLLPQELKLTEPADILIANILAQPLIDLAQSFANNLKSTGNIVLSGILASQVELIRTAYLHWFKLTELKIEEDWALLAGKKN